MKLGAERDAPLMATSRKFAAATSRSWVGLTTGGDMQIKPDRDALPQFVFRIMFRKMGRTYPRLLTRARFSGSRMRYTMDTNVIAGMRCQ